MGAFDLLWHLVGLFALPVLFGALAAGGARLIWRRRFAQRPWARLLLVACGAAAVVTLVGLIAFGRDGRMATYLLMVGVVAAVLGWLGRRPRT